MRILYWNCGSLNVRKAEAEKLVYTADIVCLQETQKHIIKPSDFQPPVCNEAGHGQLICIRKGIRFKRLDLTRWTDENLHLCGIELIDQPVRNVVNVYACNRSMKQDNWMVLDDIQSVLPGEIIFCGDFNARGSLWGNTVINPQGEALEDALDRCSITCINNGSMTREASRPGDSDGAIDLAITSLNIATRCKWQTLGKYSNDHYPCTVWIKRQKVQKKLRRKRAFKYDCTEASVLNTVRQKAGTRPTEQRPNNQSQFQQPPWFTPEIKKLWEAKRCAQKRASRDRNNPTLKDEAKAATKTFEEEVKKVKGQMYEDFSLSVSEDKSLYKFWQLYASMNRTKRHAEMPDFRREDDLWMRTDEEKGTALFERYLQQTDQKNADSRLELLQSLQTGYGTELRWPFLALYPDKLSRIIKHASDSAPGPDGVTYNHLSSLDSDELTALTDVLIESVQDSNIPEDWLDSHLCPVPKPGKDLSSIKGYRIITMQNTIGKLLEKVVARLLAEELEAKGLLPPTLGSYRRGKETWMNAAVLASDVYDGFEKKEETIVIALDLEDAYNRVQYDVLMRTLARMKVSPLLVMWTGAALLKRKVALRVGSWSSEVHSITPGLPQGSALSPVLFNVYTVGITSNQLEGPGRTLSFADDVLVYRSGRNRDEVAQSAQEEIDRIGEWCQSHNGKLHPDKACILWCSLNNHAVRATMPTVSIQGKELAREHSLKYLGVTFDRSLSFNIHISNVINRARKGLTAVKTMASAQMPQRVLLILYKALVLSVIDYGFGLLTLSTAQLKRLETIQNEGMRSVLGCTKDTSAEAMRYILDLPPMEDRHKLAQVKAYTRVAADVSNPLHTKIGRDTKTRLKRGAEWLTQASRTIEGCMSVESVRKGEAWPQLQVDTERFTEVIATLGRQCREWAPGATHAEIETIIEENSSEGDVIVFTDGSVIRGKKSGWAYTARVDGIKVSENSAACDSTMSSMMTEINAVTLALTWLKDTEYSRVVFVSDSLSTLEKIRQGNLHADWTPLINESRIHRIKWIYCPGHAGVIGNEAADKLAGNAQIDENIQAIFDGSSVESMVENELASKRDCHPSNSYTLQCLKEKGFKRGQGSKSELRGDTRRLNNQLLCETVSMRTLRWTVARRAEQTWACPTCYDANQDSR